MEELPPVRSLTNRYANHELRERNARGIWIIDKLELRVPKSCLHTYKLAYYRLFTAITIINNYIKGYLLNINYYVHVIFMQNYEKNSGNK